MYACFVELSKAFERFNHRLLLEKNRRIGFPSMPVDMFDFTFENGKVCVKYTKLFSDESSVHRGVRQGVVTST